MEIKTFLNSNERVITVGQNFKRCYFRYRSENILVDGGVIDLFEFISQSPKSPFILVNINASRQDTRKLCASVQGNSMMKFMCIKQNKLIDRSNRSIVSDPSEVSAQNEFDFTAQEDSQCNIYYQPDLRRTLIDLPFSEIRDLRIIDKLLIKEKIFKQGLKETAYASILNITNQDVQKVIVINASSSFCISNIMTELLATRLFGTYLSSNSLRILLEEEEKCKHIRENFEELLSFVIKHVDPKIIREYINKNLIDSD